MIDKDRMGFSAWMFSNTASDIMSKQVKGKTSVMNDTSYFYSFPTEYEEFSLLSLNIYIYIYK